MGGICNIPTMKISNEKEDDGYDGENEKGSGKASNKRLPEPTNNKTQTTGVGLHQSMHPAPNKPTQQHSQHKSRINMAFLCSTAAPSSIAIL